MWDNMLGRTFLGLWWVPTIAAMLLVLHGWWAVTCGDQAAIQRGGAALIIFGILVASLPYWGQKFSDLVERAIPIRGSFYGSSSGLSVSRRRDAARPQASREIFTERYLGVIVILIGTAVNGYGDLLLKWLGLLP
jgi:hypothetical protein